MSVWRTGPVTIKRNIYIMYAVSLLQGMVFYGPIATLYREAAGVSVFEITLIESISLALCMALELPLGIIADRIGYKTTAVLCCALYFVSKIVFWQATGFFMFLLERLMLSVVMAGLSGVDTSILYLSCKPERAQSVFGIYNALCTAGLLAAAGFYSFFIGENYRLAGFLTVISYGAAAVLMLFLREVKPAERQVSGKERARDFVFTLKSVLKDGTLLLLLAATALISETNQTLTVFLAQLRYSESGLSDRVIGILYIALTLAGLLGVFSARFTKLCGKKRSGILLFISAAAACALLALTGNAWLSVSAFLLLRICASLFAPLSSDLQNIRIKVADRATALSVNALLLDSAGILTNLLFGRLAEFSLSYAFMLGALFCAAGAVFYTVGERRAIICKS